MRISDWSSDVCSSDLVDRLAVLRKACERTWERRALGRTVAVDFAALFQDVLTQFDTQPDDFSPQRVQDELVGQMAELLVADYDTLALEINDSESRQRRSEEHTSELQSLMRISYAVFCLKKNTE